MMRLIAPILVFLLALIPAAGSVQEAITSTPLGEATVTQLPSESLVWRLETFSDTATAESAMTDTSLVVESGGQVMLATLGPAGGSSEGGTLVAEIGPVNAPNASQYLLRVVQLSGPTGSQTSVHSHPGAEVYYVLTGELTARSDTGENSAAAGQGFVGPEAGSAMQVVSTGSNDLLALALFVVDASQAFSSPAEFHAMPGWPNTGAGGPPETIPRWTGACYWPSWQPASSRLAEASSCSSAGLSRQTDIRQTKRPGQGVRPAPVASHPCARIVSPSPSTYTRRAI